MQETASSSDYEAANKLVGPELSPLQDSLYVHGEQLDKLTALVTNLEEKLVSVRNQVPADSGRDVASAPPPSSPVVDHMRRMTGLVQNLQTRINDLTKELEV